MMRPTFVITKMVEDKIRHFECSVVWLRTWRRPERRPSPSCRPTCTLLVTPGVFRISVTAMAAGVQLAAEKWGSVRHGHSSVVMSGGGEGDKYPDPVHYHHM